MHTVYLDTHGIQICGFSDGFGELNMIDIIFKNAVCFLETS